MSIRSQAGNVRRKVLSSLCRRPVPLGGRDSIVTFCFDDFPRTALTVGAPILESFGAHATYYVAMSLVNSRNELGEQFRHEDLGSLRYRGHELASHTFSHLSARRVGYDAFEDDVKAGEEAIRASVGAPTSGNFAYPYGHVTVGSKKKLGPKFMSCRGTFSGLNGPDLDLNLLRANSLYGDVDQLDVVKRLIVENEKKNFWLIFYSHDVASKPSRFGCTPELLEATCSLAAAHHARFMTVAQVMEQLGQERCSSVKAEVATSVGSVC
jgi:peptidoglycan/xylan/chitin deacetylase (PgdA/CDA1 family)